MRLLLIGAFLASCSSGPKTTGGGGDTTTPKPPPATGGDQGDKRDACLMAQEFEVQAWLNHAVTQDDETETWATLGMVMTLTEPAVLEEMAEVDPNATTAVSKSRDTWQACRGVMAINCASLDQAAELTEVRIGADVWRSDDLIDRCSEGQVDEEQADCVLAARDAEVARGCLGEVPVARR